MKVKKHKLLDGTESTAVFSDCENYRYALQKIWNPVGQLLIFIMLNPSTATELVNDPTIERCERRARQWGFAGIQILNLFAFRATLPENMKKQSDPVGPRNDAFIIEAIESAKDGKCKIVCGWGTHGVHLSRDKEIYLMFNRAGLDPSALKWTKDGHPQHPLYVSYNEMPKDRP